MCVTAKGENFEPTYLRLNPAGTSFTIHPLCTTHSQRGVPGTVPTLVVPLDKTISPEIESRYKAIQDTKVRGHVVY